MKTGARVAAVASAVVLVSASAGSAAQAPRVSVKPATGLLDAPFAITISGLQPRQTVTLNLKEAAYAGGVLSASRRARADNRGVISLPRSGLLGLVSLPHGSKGTGVPHFTRTLRLTVKAKGHVIASATAHRHVTASSVSILDERPQDAGFYGEYFRPAGATSHRAVVLIGGSEGGLPNGFAAGLLASHGYPVLEVAYFGEPGLPRALENVPLEYFQRAISWLARQPEVDPKRVSLIGVSRGGEAALLLGATYPHLTRGVAAYVPSDNVYPSLLHPSLPSWTLGGRPVASARIAVEKINGPVFVVGGGDDQLWPSGQAVSDISKRMRANNRADVTALVYPRAGHGAGAIVPNFPTTPTINSRYGMLFLGGTPAADAASRADSWPRLLRFLQSP